MLDQPLVLPPAGSDTSIVIHTAVMPAVMPAVPMTVPVPMAMPNQGNPAGGGLVNEGLYTAIEVHWSAIQAEIVKIDMLRKQVDGMMSELSGLNRDLNYDENTHTSRQDKAAWAAARSRSSVSSTLWRGALLLCVPPPLHMHFNRHTRFC